MLFYSGDECETRDGALKSGFDKLNAVEPNKRILYETKCLLDNCVRIN